jgi:hypothetical protein
MNKDITIISALLNYMTLNSMFLTIGLSPVTEYNLPYLDETSKLGTSSNILTPTKRPPNETSQDPCVHCDIWSQGRQIVCTLWTFHFGHFLEANIIAEQSVHCIFGQPNHVTFCPIVTFQPNVFNVHFSYKNWDSPSHSDLYTFVTSFDVFYVPFSHFVTFCHYATLFWLCNILSICLWMSVRQKQKFTNP